MPPKAPAPPPPPKLDFPSALEVLRAGLATPEQLDPALLPQALGYFHGLSDSQLPQVPQDVIILIQLIVPYLQHQDGLVASTAIKALNKLVDARQATLDAFIQPESIQALWSVLVSFHEHFDEYAAALLALRSEVPETPGAARAAKDKAAKPDKNAPLIPVDPDSALPGPSKHALDCALTGLTLVLAAGGSHVLEATAEACSVLPLLTLLQHHSCRIQVLTLRLLRVLVRCTPLAEGLCRWGLQACLEGLVGAEGFGLPGVTAGVPPTRAAASSGSPFGSVREEAMELLSHLWAAAGSSLHEAVESPVLLPLLLQHVLDPTTGAVQQQQQQQQQLPAEGGEPGAVPEGEEVPAPPPPPRPLDFSRPVASSAAKLQVLAARLLLQAASHHHGAVQVLLRQGALQLACALLPAPELPELPPMPPPKRPPSAAADTIFAGIMPGGRASRTGQASKPSTPEVRPAAALKEPWLPFLESCPYPLPATKASSPELQAPLLRLVACLLSEPGVQDAWWSWHATKRPHLQLAYLLQPTAPPPPPSAAPPEPAAPPPTTPGPPAKGAKAPATPAAPPPPPPPPPPDPLQPPFPPAVRAAALQCLLQLAKHSEWLTLIPFLTGLQQTLADKDSWAPQMVTPMALLLQRTLEARLPPPPGAGRVGPPAPPARGRRSSSSDMPGSPLRETAAPTPPPAAQPPQPEQSFPEQQPDLLPPPQEPNATPNGLPPEANGLAERAVGSEEACVVLKGLAKVASQGNDPGAKSAVAHALMVLPDRALYAPAWPPLPSPPPTPPPPPLPTSQFLWDALGRPVMSDGIKLVHV